MTPLNALMLGVFIGCMGGLVIGWFAWRLPMVFAEQRGQELDADGQKHKSTGPKASFYI
jgi:hypothetical protein